MPVSGGGGEYLWPGCCCWGAEAGLSSSSMFVGPTTGASGSNGGDGGAGRRSDILAGAPCGPGRSPEAAGCHPHPCTRTPPAVALAGRR